LLESSFIDTNATLGAGEFDGEPSVQPIAVPSVLKSGEVYLKTHDAKDNAPTVVLIAFLDAIITPLSISDVRVLHSNISIVDDNANFAFKLGNYYVYHFNLNVDNSDIGSGEQILLFPYTPAGNTRVCISGEFEVRGAAYIGMGDRILQTGRSGLWKPGHINILAVYKALN